MERKLTAVLYIFTFIILCFNSPAAFCAATNEPEVQSANKAKIEEPPPKKSQKHEKKYSFKINDTIDIDIECVNINVCEPLRVG